MADGIMIIALVLAVILATQDSNSDSGKGSF